MCRINIAMGQQVNLVEPLLFLLYSLRVNMSEFIVNFDSSSLNLVMNVSVQFFLLWTVIVDSDF
jgi:hypothetical protein